MKNRKYIPLVLAILWCCFLLVGCSMQKERTTIADSRALFANGLLSAKEDGFWGYINANGDFVISPQFDYAYEFSSGGVARVRFGDKYGYIDTNGKYLIEPQYDYAEDFADNGLALVKIEEQFGYIDVEGNYAINPQFDDAYGFGKGAYAAVCVGNQ